MAKYEKPITDNMKDKANKLFIFLKQIGRYATKEEIGEYLGVSNERVVRDIISVLATRKPIISKSNSCGYRLAMTIDDLEEVENVWSEIDSRIEQLEERKKPLIAFYEKMKYNIKGENNDYSKRI
jgi:biotin operon repressor